MRDWILLATYSETDSTLSRRLAAVHVENSQNHTMLKNGANLGATSESAMVGL